MKTLGVVLGLALVGAAGGAHAACVTPAPVKAYLANNPGWQVLEEAALVADDRALWTSAHAGQCPGIASADFTGSGKTAYAVTLTKAADKDKAHKVVLIDGASVQTLRGPSAGYTVVWVAPAGDLIETQTGRRVTARHPAFVLEAPESSAQVFYAANGKIGSVWTSD